MTELRVTRRYVHGLIEAAQAQGQVDAVEAVLKDLHAVIEQNRELRSLLYHPTISRSRKKDLLGKIIGERAPELARRFIDLVIEKKRERVLEAAYGEFKAAADALRGIVRAKVTAAGPLTSAQAARLQEQLERKLGKKVIVETGIDTELLGGMQIMIGTYILDGSIKGRLSRIHKHLQEEVSNIKSVA